MAGPFQVLTGADPVRSIPLHTEGPWYLRFGDQVVNRPTCVCEGMEQMEGLRLLVGLMAMRRVLAAGVGIALLVGAACAPASSGASRAPSDPYVIGSLFSTTGPLSALGAPEAHGARIYAAMVNESGGVNGHPLKLVEHDAQSQPEVAARFAREVVQVEGATAIVGPEGFALVTAMLPVIDELRVPVVSTQGAVSGAKFNSTTHHWFFSTISGFGITEIDLQLHYLQTQGKKTLAILTSNDAVGDSANPTIKPIADKYGLQIVGEARFSNQDRDLTVQLTQIKNMSPKPAAVYLWSGINHALAYRNSKELGMDKDMPVLDEPSDPVTLKELGPLADGLVTAARKADIYDSLAESDPFKVSARDFATRWAKEAPGEPLGLALSGASGLKMIIEALKAVGKDSAKMRDYIEGSESGMTQVGYAFAFSKDDHAGLSPENLLLVRREGSQWVKVSSP